MKNLVMSGVIALCLLAGSAQAADTTYNWSGFYLGTSLGYTWSNIDWTLQGSQFWGPNGGGESFAPSQVDVGAYLGFQHQWKWLVLGAEAGIYKGPYYEESKESPYYPVTDEWTADISTIAKGTAKVGFAFKRLLGYAKGGYAGALVKTRTRFNVASGVIIYDGETSEWHNGWTAGGGIEYALTDHWILGTEYSYIDLGSKTHTVGNYSAKVDAIVQQAMFLVSFKF